MDLVWQNLPLDVVDQVLRRTTIDARIALKVAPSKVTIPEGFTSAWIKKPRAARPGDVTLPLDPVSGRHYRIVVREAGQNMLFHNNTDAQDDGPGTCWFWPLQ